jgi:hypothetical protein
LRDLVISVLHPLRQSRTLHTLTFGPISGVHFSEPVTQQRTEAVGVNLAFGGREVAWSRSRRHRAGWQNQRLVYCRFEIAGADLMRPSDQQFVEFLS